MKILTNKLIMRFDEFENFHLGGFSFKKDGKYIFRIHIGIDFNNYVENNYIEEWLYDFYNSLSKDNNSFPRAFIGSNENFEVLMSQTEKKHINEK
jgi:hypothetical protein